MDEHAPYRSKEPNAEQLEIEEDEVEDDGENEDEDDEEEDNYEYPDPKPTHPAHHPMKTSNVKHHYRTSFTN